MHGEFSIHHFSLPSHSTRHALWLFYHDWTIRYATVSGISKQQSDTQLFLARGSGTKPGRVAQAIKTLAHGPLTWCVKLWVTHAPGLPGTMSLSPTSKETACITAHARRTCRETCRDRLTRSGGENVTSILGACATGKYTYMVRGPVILACNNINHYPATSFW